MKNNNGKKLIVIGVAFVLLVIILIANAIEDANQNSQSETPDIPDPTLTISISSPLIFNNTDGADSAKIINDAAKTIVCNYNDGTLCFTDSVKINLSSVVNNDSLFKFNAGSDQTISINEGKKVCIVCDYQYIKMTEDRDYAVISCDSSLKFTGSGQLKIEITKNSTVAGTYSWDVIYAKGNVRFDNNKLEFCNPENIAPGYGVVYSGQDITFNKCNVTCTTAGHAFYCKNTDTNRLELDQCNIKAYTGDNAFKFSSVRTGSSTLASVYGSDGNNQVEKIEFDKIDCYDNIEVRSESIYGMDGKTVAIAIGVIIGIVLVLMIIIKIYKRTKVLKSSSNQEAVYYEPSLFGDKANNNTSNDNSDDARSFSEDSVEITASTSVKDGSFILQIDGMVLGYIGSIKSTFDAPKGMHEVKILTNDMRRKEIFSENIQFDTPMEFTVKKKIGGYTIERR